MKNILILTLFIALCSCDGVTKKKNQASETVSEKKDMITQNNSNADETQLTLYGDQSEVQIYTNNDGIISVKEQFIDAQNPSVESLSYTLQNPLSTIVSTSTYTLKTGRFEGWEDEPGDFNVIEISKNGQQKLIYKDDYGITKIINKKKEGYFYATSLSPYSSNGYFIEVSMTPTSKALLFLGQDYGTDLSRLIIFIITDSDVKLVHNKPMEIRSIDTSAGNFSLSLKSTIEEISGLEDMHTIFLKDGVLFFRNESNPEEQMIKRRIVDFYLNYIAANYGIPPDSSRINSLKKEYCTTKLIHFSEQDELDYDVFFNAQEILSDWFYTLSIAKESDQYIVSYYDSYTKTQPKIKLTVVEENGKYKIDTVEY